LAERRYDVEAGHTQGVQRDYLISHEGTGEDDDTFIQLFVEWLDQDGSAIPDALKVSRPQAVRTSAMRVSRLFLKLSLDSGLEPKAPDLENSGNFVSGPNDRLFGRFRAIKPPCPLRCPVRRLSVPLPCRFQGFFKK